MSASDGRTCATCQHAHHTLSDQSYDCRAFPYVYDGQTMQYNPFWRVPATFYCAAWRAKLAKAPEVRA